MEGRNVEGIGYHMIKNYGSKGDAHTKFSFDGFAILRFLRRNKRYKFRVFLIFTIASKFLLQLRDEFGPKIN